MSTPISILKQRSSGILLPIFSLPAPCGIGDLGAKAYEFIDFLQSAKQSCWQILPLGPTSRDMGDSPYMSFSAFAGNPLFISPEMLMEEGLLHSDQLAYPQFSEYAVNYWQVAAHKEYLFHLAWNNFQGQAALAVLEEFVASNPWLRQHALFIALKNKYQQQPWYTWPQALRMGDARALALAEDELQAELRFIYFIQYLFSQQWRRLHQYAQAHGVHFIGDLPIYVAEDSVDAWANQSIFELDPIAARPLQVAGVPPDYFSKTGQRWGNPLYDWNSTSPLVRAQLWHWWEERLRRNFSFTDILRIDHFRGFESYWSIPTRAATAMEGAWRPGPGKDFFREMERRLGVMPIIAEDLGIITPAVEALRRELGYPGMKILLFAFDCLPDNTHLPYHCEPTSVMYIGTHDNETALGWYLNPEVDPAFKRQARRFARRSEQDDRPDFHLDLIYLAMSSPSNLAIFPMQDLLGFGNDCRINTPGQAKGNWQWRCAPRFINQGLAGWFAELSSFFGRVPPPQLEQ